MNTQTETFSLDDLDDFTPMVGSEQVITSNESKPNIFVRDNTDMSFLDDEDPAPEPTKKETAKDKAVDPNAEEDEEEEVPIDAEETDALLEALDTVEEETTGKGKPSKSDTIEVFKKLIESEVLIGFDDDKPLEEYSAKDFQELIQANFEEKAKASKNSGLEELKSSLPEDMQRALQYVMDGGQDMKSLFKALAYTHDIKSLDPQKDARAIVENYLVAKNVYETDEELQSQIDEWDNLGMLDKKATQFKPYLDSMQDKVVENKIKQQEAYKQRQEELADNYMSNVYEALKPGELNGIKLDKKIQKDLFQGLTTAKYESKMSNQPTNLLGHLLEKHQFSENPRYDLIAEATWLLSDPEAYRAELKKSISTEVTKDTVRTLKTEGARRIATSGAPIQEEKQTIETARKKITRPTNIFKR